MLHEQWKTVSPAPAPAPAPAAATMIAAGGPSIRLSRLSDELLARWATLLSDLAELPDRLRGALLLRELNGLSHEEIAVPLETTVGGAKQSIFEAREALS